MKKILLAILSGSAIMASAADFSISDDSPLTAKLMDQAWSNRQNVNNQKAIAAYLMKAPAIPQDYETAWKTARMVSFIGNYGYGEKVFVSTSDGVKLFDYGVQAGKVATSQKANGVEGLYWYAVDLGSYGLAKGVFAAAKGAGPGMDALKKVISIDPTYQGYGSSRILGRYYQELPGLMGGSDSKAEKYLTDATTKAPQVRNNWVFLGQYYISTKDYQKAIDSCQKAIDVTSSEGQYEEKRYLREANECLTKAKAKLSS